MLKGQHMEKHKQRERQRFKPYLPYHSHRIPFHATNLESLVIFLKCLVKRLVLVGLLIPTQIPSTTVMQIHVNKAAKLNKKTPIKIST